jgi:subtilase family serine protease
MSRRTITAAVAAVAGLVIAGAGTGTAANATTTPVPHTIVGSAVPFTSTAHSTGTVAGTSKLTIQLWLTPKTAQAQSYVTAVSTPGNAAYRKYLSPSEYAARYGATAAHASAVKAWLKSEGFTGISTDAERDYVTATAPVSDIQAAFRTTIRYYQSSASATAGRYRLRANASALTLPSSLSGIVLGVTGLDNADPIQPIVRQNSLPARLGTVPKAAAASPTYACSNYYGQYTATLDYPQAGTSYPTAVCGYSAGQLRSAYGANTVNTGKGETIALVEDGLTPGMFGTLTDYAASNGLPAPSASRYKELNIGNVSYAACGDAFYGEESLDVEAAYAMAPGATQYVIGGDGCDNGYGGLQGLFDADLAVINGNGETPLATIASNSWESGGEAQAAVITDIEHAYLVKAAAEGVGEYFSSGDGSGVLSPSSDPYAVAVGGTTLGIGETGNRLFETGWSTDVAVSFSGTWLDLGEDGASGGGPSELWNQPWYQKGVVPTALATVAGDRGGLVRSAPDISADADPFTGMLVLLQNLSATGVVTGYASEAIGGTSLASPLVAGIITAAQQGQHEPFGFIDPAIYKLARSGTGAFNDALPLTTATPAAYNGVACDPYYCGLLLVTTFDDQSWDMAGYNGQVTLHGYDNMTGIGTPAGPSFITRLRALRA